MDNCPVQRTPSRALRAQLPFLKRSQLNVNIKEEGSKNHLVTNIVVANPALYINTTQIFYTNEPTKDWPASMQFKYQALCAPLISLEYSMKYNPAKGQLLPAPVSRSKSIMLSGCWNRLCVCKFLSGDNIRHLWCCEGVNIYPSD